MTHPSPISGLADTNLRESAKTALMYLETGYLECDRCGHEMPTSILDAALELKDGLAALASPLPVATQGGVTEASEQLARRIWGYFKGDVAWFDENKALDGPAYIIGLCEASITKTAAPLGVGGDIVERSARVVEADVERRVKVPAGQTPLNDDLHHPLLDAFNAGSKSRDTGTPSPYHGHSLEHLLHASGWVQRDLRLALDKAKAEAFEEAAQVADEHAKACAEMAASSYYSSAESAVLNMGRGLAAAIRSRAASKGDGK